MRRTARAPRRSRSRILGVACCLLLLWMACGPSAPGIIRYDDRPEEHRFPLSALGAYSAGVWTPHLGDPFTASVTLYATRSVTAHLEEVRLVTQSGNLEILGVQAVGPERRLGQAIGSHGFPPADLPPSMRTRYRPLEEVPVTATKVDGVDGVDVIIGLRFRHGTRAWFDGIEVTYRVDGRRYIGRFAVAWGMCTYHPCPTPGIGKPWGDSR